MALPRNEWRPGMSMRVGIVTDATCDLPRLFLDRHGVVIVPLALHLGETDFSDQRNPLYTLEFFNKLKPGQLQSTELTVPGMQAIRDLFLQRLIMDYDFVFCVTNDSVPEGLLTQATRASYAILGSYKRIRQEAGVEGPFALRVVDSRNLYTGQALVVSELLRQLDEGQSVGELRQYLRTFTQYVQTYVLPTEVRQLHNGAAAGSERGGGLGGAIVANALNIKPIFRINQQRTERIFKAVGYRHGVSKLFEHTIARINQGLKAPLVCISFGGNSDAVFRMPGFDALQKAAEDKKVTLTVSEMSPTAAVSVGLRALSISFATEHQAFV